jgi:hypothetical protein
VSVLAELERQILAVALIRRRARVSIVHQATLVPRHRLRHLHQELHGCPASCGQLPALGGAAIKTRTRQVHASLFAVLHRVHAGPGTDRPVDLNALIGAYDLYREIAAESAQLTFNDAWVIVRDLRIGTAELRHCRSCEVPYLIASASRLAPTCPFCALYARRGGRQRPPPDGDEPRDGPEPPGSSP